MLGLLILSMIAGLIGSIFGLGGGIIVVPVLTVLYDMPTVEAAAISLVAIVAISSTSASTLIRNRVSNVRIGLRLEVAAAAGAIVGAAIALYVESWVLATAFALVLIYSAVYMFLKPERQADKGSPDDEFVYHDERTNEDVPYNAENVGTGMIGFVAAGITSALTGVGGGTIKIPVMNVHMRMPIKAATATSSYVIGLTAFSGAIIFLLTGVLTEIVQTAAIVVIGAFAGSLIGLKILPRINAQGLRRYFSVLLIFLACVMLLNVGGVI